MKILLIIILLVQSLPCQTTDLKSASKKVVRAYEQLNKNSRNDSVQLNYIRSFPHDWRTFLSVFQPDDLSQLYPKYDDYTTVLDSLRIKYPVEVGKLLIGLACKAKWEADATGDVQHILGRFAVCNTILFAKLLREQTKSEQNNVIKFLADVENHDAYPEYQSIIDNLNASKQYQLSKKFEIARKLRIREPH